MRPTAIVVGDNQEKCKMVKFVIISLTLLLALSHAAPADKAEAKDLATAPLEKEDLKTAASHWGGLGYGHWGGYGGWGSPYYGGYGGYSHYGWPSYSYGYGWPYGYGGYGGYGYGYGLGHGYWW